MTALACGLLAALAFLNRRIGHSLFYPPALFCAWWSVLLLILALSGDAFFDLSFTTLTIYMLGAVAFTVGGAFRIALHPLVKQSHAISEEQQRAAGRFLLFAAIVLTVAFPFYWQHLQDLRAASFYPDFWRAVRHQTTSGLVDDVGLGIFKYAISLGSFMSLIAVYHDNGSRRTRWRAVGIVATALLYHFLTAARIGAMTLLFGILAVSRMRSGSVNWKVWCAGAMLLAIVFTVPAVLLQKGGDPTKSLGENISGVLGSLRLYMVSGLVGFNQVVDDPGVFPRWLSFRFFLALGHAFVPSIEVPGIVLPFTATPALTNVYTIYGSYFADFGWLGIALIMCIHGYLIAALYQNAQRGHPEAVILYGVAVSYLLASAATEGFLVALSHWVQVAICTLAVYRWQPMGRKRRRGANGAGAPFDSATQPVLP
jgi:oligosaccharide repeat unit polymerase